MITGDKQETAINIAISCKLIRYPDSLLICNAASPEAAHSRLRELDALLQAKFAPVGKQKAGVLLFCINSLAVCSLAPLGFTSHVQCSLLVLCCWPVH